MRGLSLTGLCLGAVAGLTMTPAGAAGAIIQPGLYQLHNHPDGNQDPPPYGLRLDELYDATANHDVFTFDFDHPASNVIMNFAPGLITISGQAWGGRDVGNVYANDVYLGLYTVNFTYALGIAPVPGDDDWQVVPGADYTNTGFISTPLSDVISLGDKRDGTGMSFRLGDEDDDLGHRGFAGISGWGWLTHAFESRPHVTSTDWIFTAEFIPSPGTGATALLGLVGLARRRRR